MFTVRTFLLMAVCILKNAKAQDLRTTCPANEFEEGIHSQVNCSVNRSFFDNNCLPTPTDVTFVFARSGGANIPWCSTNYQNCATTGRPEPACNGCSCSCIDDTTNIIIFSLTFVPDYSHHAGSFICQLACFGQNPTDNFTSCEQFSVATTTTTTTTTTPTTTTTIREIPPDDGPTCETGCIIGSTVGTVVAALVTGGAAAMWAMTIKVDVGYPREQITRIKEYATKLNALLKPKDGKDHLKDSLEEKIQEKLNTSFRFDVSIDGNYAIQADGMPKTDKDHLHVLVQLSKIPNVTKFNDIYKAVTNFVAENVRKNHVRTVVVLEDTEIPDMASIAKETGTSIFPEKSTSQGDTPKKKPQCVIQIEGAEGAVDDAKEKIGARPLPEPGKKENKQEKAERAEHQRLQTISERPEYEGAESAEKKRLQAMKIKPQIGEAEGAVGDTENKKKKPQYVIQIEGAEGAVDDAETKVKSALWNLNPVDRTIAVSPQTPQIEDLARQYIEEMTGTTINQTDDCLRSILIQGSNEKYIKTAENKVFDFLNGKVRLVLVPKKTPVKKEALDKIEEETGTTVCYPLENGKERLVVHIEGPNKEKAAEAASKVEALFTPTSIWPFRSRTAASRSEIV